MDMGDDSAEILFQSFPRKAIVSSSGMGRNVSLFDIVHPAFRLPIEVWYGILKGGFSEAVVARRATVMVTKSLFITIHGSCNNAND